MSSSPAAEGDAFFSAHSPLPKPTLLSLPKELLTSISLFLDLHSALDLALVCRELLVPAQHRIWDHLDLTIHKNVGEYPLIRPIGHGHPEYWDWAHKVANEAEKRHRMAVTEKINSIMMNSGMHRLRMVKSVTASPRAGSNLALAQFLTTVAPNLTELALLPPVRHCFDESFESNYTTSLFFHMLSFDKMDISFSALTHLTVGPKLMIYYNTIDQLRRLAPNLLYLDLDFSTTRKKTWTRSEAADGAGSTTLMIPVAPIKYERYSPLRYLRLAGNTSGGKCPESVVRVVQDSDITHLELSNVPKRDVDGDYIFESFPGGRLHGTSLRLRSDTYGLVREHKEGGNKLASYIEVERLSVRGDGAGTHHFEFLTLPNIHGLEHLRIEIAGETTVGRNAQDQGSIPTTAFPEADPCKPISPSIIEGITACPALERIEYVPRTVVASDDNWMVEPYPISAWAEKGITGSVIRSFKHGDGQLIHVRTFSKYRRVHPVNTTAADAARFWPRKDYLIQRSAKSGDDYNVQVQDVNTCDWEDATDYKGMVVPLDVLREMRMADDKTVEEWQGRGVEVGEAGWKVLLDWEAKQPGFVKPTVQDIIGQPPLAEGTIVAVERKDGDANGGEDDEENDAEISESGLGEEDEEDDEDQDAEGSDDETQSQVDFDSDDESDH